MESWKEELYHHGILGQKWGVRRFQNSDGTYTAEGKARRNDSSEGSSRKSSKSSRSNSERNKKIAKYAIAGAIGAATIAAAAIYVKNNPQIGLKVAGMTNVLSAKISDIGKTKIAQGKNHIERALQKGKNMAVISRAASKAYVKEKIKDSWGGFVSGINKGFKEAPEKAGKAIVTGVTLLTIKKLLDRSVGKEEAAKIMKANNNKKIDSFWKIDDPRDKDEGDN